ncbi:hypothetical protein F5Y15DRAFT_146088 [Xylariaceae sp. FL0016]|nr:hypothetical protein F5Y15DRAFT_146088 [Xylariaceae sp. FL0016]
MSSALIRSHRIARDTPRRSHRPASLAIHSRSLIVEKAGLVRSLLKQTMNLGRSTLSPEGDAWRAEWLGRSGVCLLILDAFLNIVLTLVVAVRAARGDAKPTFDIVLGYGLTRVVCVGALTGSWLYLKSRLLGRGNYPGKSDFRSEAAYVARMTLEIVLVGVMLPFLGAAWLYRGAVSWAAEKKKRGGADGATEHNPQGSFRLLRDVEAAQELPARQPVTVARHEPERFTGSHPRASRDGTPTVQNPYSSPFAHELEHRNHSTSSRNTWAENGGACRRTDMPFQRTSIKTSWTASDEDLSEVDLADDNGYLGNLMGGITPRASTVSARSTYRGQEEARRGESRHDPPRIVEAERHHSVRVSIEGDGGPEHPYATTDGPVRYRGRPTGRGRGGRTYPRPDGGTGSRAFEQL